MGVIPPHGTNSAHLPSSGAFHCKFFYDGGPLKQKLILPFAPFICNIVIHMNNAIVVYKVC